MCGRVFGILLCVKMAAESKPGSFKPLPIPFWIGFGALWIFVWTLTAIHWSASVGDSFPYSSLGPVGTLLHYLAYDQSTLTTWTLRVIYGIHVIEGLLSLWMCLSAGISLTDTVKWTLQSGLLGFKAVQALQAECTKIKQLKVQ